MSFFIKCNLGLPQGCKSCPFNYTDVCIASNKGIDTRAFVHLRHPDCPMVELPTPHGRLIDADKFLKDNADFADRDFIHPSSEVTLRELIDGAPTIIEAEVSE